MLIFQLLRSLLKFPLLLPLVDDVTHVVLLLTLLLQTLLLGLALERLVFTVALQTFTGLLLRGLCLQILLTRQA